jgi:hypothetical protein
VKKIMEKKSKKPDSITLKVNVTLEQVKDREIPEAMAYAFDQNGQFLTSAQLHDNKKSERAVRLELPRELLGTTVRVLLGPQLIEENSEMPSWMIKMVQKSERQKKMPSLAVLKRRGAYEKRIRLHTEIETLKVAILPPDWTKWLQCKCVVQGRLIKFLTLPDGTTKEMGVCNACVSIYEVDSFPKFILQLPERDLFRLREDLRVIVEKKPPRFPPKKLLSAHIEENQIATKLEPVFTAASVPQLRQALIANTNLLVNFVCTLKWLHFYFHTDFIKCVKTDEQGRFKTTIWYLCSGDKPDLYFKAGQCIGGTWTIIYDPGVACNTYWNFECGSEVVLEVNDPAAIVCAPPIPVNLPQGVTGLWVMPYGVGGQRMDEIMSSGLTNYGGIVDAPFGGRLGLRHGYSSAIPLVGPNKPFYYRWRYKKESEPDWHDLAGLVAETVVRHYVDEDLSKPDEPPTFPTYTLGPHSKLGKHLYEFKPHKPQPQIPGHHIYWPTDTWFADIYTGIMHSTNLPGGVDISAGKYKFKLEIYDQKGKRVAPGPSTFQFIVPTGYASDGVTIDSRLALLSEIEDDGFVFCIHVDNRKCAATIDAPTIGGVSAGDECGFLRYISGDQVRIDFHALHPANFATFDFWLKRAAKTLYPVWDEEVAANPAGDYEGDGNGNFWKSDFSTGALLELCPEAAFAEILRVRAKCTNGWNRLSQYDAHDERAFALAKETSDGATT